MAARRVFGDRAREEYHDPYYSNPNNIQPGGQNENGFRGNSDLPDRHQRSNDQWQDQQIGHRHPHPGDLQHYQYPSSRLEGMKPKRKPKYMPQTKSELELFDENFQIKEGEHFEELFGLQRNPEIVVTGGDDIEQAPVNAQIIEHFEDCGFSKEVLQNIKFRKYRHPTSIQRAIIPLLMGNKQMDIMAHAETGSGKTAAFMLPIICRLQQEMLKPRTQLNLRMAPYCIILAPTKELTEQLYEEALSFTVNTHIKVSRSYGEMPMRATMEQIEKGCDILVVTSGRLKHHIVDHIKLTNLRYFVLDEGDKLIKERYFYDTVSCVKQHEDIAPDLQMLLFSATYNTNVQIVASNILRRGYRFVHVGELNQPVKTITQHFIEVKKFDKTDMLLEVLQDGAEEKTLPSGTRRLQPKWKTIVFCEEKRQSDRVGIFLNNADIRAMSLNSDRSLKQRTVAIRNFKEGLFDVLVATDVAARGLNIPQVDHVIIYDLPEREDEDDMYIHRIGRTGRAGNSGRATVFFDPTNDSNLSKADHYIKLLESNNQVVPNFLRRLAIQNLNNEREHFYDGGGLPRRQEEAWGPRPIEVNMRQEYRQNWQNGHQRPNDRHYADERIQQENDWGPKKTIRQSEEEMSSVFRQESSSNSNSHESNQEENIFRDCW